MLQNAAFNLGLHSLPKFFFEGLSILHKSLSYEIRLPTPPLRFKRDCVVSLSKNIKPGLVLVQPRKTCPFITEILLIGRKESKHTNKKNSYEDFNVCMTCLACW